MRGPGIGRSKAISTILSRAISTILCLRTTSRSSSQDILAWPIAFEGSERAANGGVVPQLEERPEHVCHETMNTKSKTLACHDTVRRHVVID